MTTKRYTPDKARRAGVYMQFIADLLKGAVRAVKVTATKDAQGRTQLDYEEPK